MHRLLVVVVLWFSFPDVTRACDPVDAQVLLTLEGGDFIFVNGQELTRVRPDGTVVLTKELEFVSQDLALMPDGRHLLNPVPVGYTGMCLGAQIEMQVIDITDDSPPRTLGTFPAAAGMGASVGSMQVRGRAMEISVGEMVDGGESWVWERVVVTPTSATRRGRARPPRAAAMTTTASRPAQAEPHRVRATTSPADSEQHWVRIVLGARTLMTIRLARSPLAALFSPDGSRVAIATYETVSEDYGTGFAARLDLVELRSGAVRTPVGDESGVTGVDGRANLRCTHHVNDPDSELNVRSGPRSRASVVGRVAHGTTLQIGERRGRWIEVRGPVTGWAWAENVERRCRRP